jgi:murein DD-endopeptidase MepM/ murein hydrolase activator NlpD
VKNRLLLTLTDVSGSRQLAFSRPILIRFVIALLVFLLALIAYPLVLNSQNSRLETAHQQLNSNHEQVQQQALKTELKYRQTAAELTTRTNSLTLKEQQLLDLEVQMNYQPGDDLSDSESYADLSNQIAFRQMVLQLLPNGRPTDYQRVTSSFGTRFHPFLKKNYQHKGIDLHVKMGTPVVATADGVVVSLQSTADGFGKLVKLRHAMGFTTYYGHLKTIGVKANTFVSKGDIIGYSGNSGRSTGPHLHYEIRFGYAAVDPANYILWTLDKFDISAKKGEKIPWGSLMAGLQKLMAIQLPRLSPKIATSPESSTLTAACTSTAGCLETSSAQVPSLLVSQGASMAK